MLFYFDEYKSFNSNKLLKINKIGIFSAKYKLK